METAADPGMCIDIVETPETHLKELFSIMTRDAVAQIKQHNRDIIDIVKALGGDAGKYKHEREAAIRAVVSEIYSPPRGAAAKKRLPEFKIIHGFALDLSMTLS